LPRLALAGGLIPRSHEWLASSGAEWNGAKRQWLFPQASGPPATLMFGYLSNPLDKYRYASSEFQFIAFDELTEIAEEDYLFLFSRLRRVKDNRPPVRMRSASNPGGVGHLWVKRRFVEQGARGQEPEAGGLLRQDERIYIPSRLADNPFLIADEYRASLMHLPPLARERLLNGDWGVQEAGLIQAAWLRYFVEENGQLELLAPSGQILATIPDGSCRRFVTIDPAGTSAERTREARGRTPSWTVVQVWDQPRRELSRFLLLRHQIRVRVGFDGLCDVLRKVHHQWRPARLWIEGEKLGQAVLDLLSRELPLALLRPGTQDKVTRAAPLTLKLERGEIHLPRYETTWRPSLEAEFLAWTGDDRQPTDQIDAAAYAAIVAQNDPAQVIKLQGLGAICLTVNDPCS
jgi:phage terminase large subunit-like protein